MDPKRKAELRAQYKQTRSDMGIYKIQCLKDGKTYYGYTQDLKGTMNGDRFKLNTGFFKNKKLEKTWKEIGESGFIIEIVEGLDYDRDESKTDYTEDLKIMLQWWIDKTENAEAI